MAKRSEFSWLQNFTESQLLAAMVNDCDRIAHITQRAFLKEELGRLIRQSQKRKALRDQDEIIFTWRRIHSELDYYGILNAYRLEPMRSRLLSFLKGTGRDPRELDS